MEEFNLDNMFNDVDIEYLQETFSFPINAMNKILFLLGSTPGHNMLTSELHKKTLPENTTSLDLDNQFATAIRILKAFKLVDYVTTDLIHLGDNGFKLFEVLDGDAVKQPYTEFLERKKKRRRDSDSMLYYQALVAKQQSELNPLLQKYNETSGKIQSSLLTINLWIMVGSLIAGVYYFCQLYDGKSVAHPYIASYSLGIVTVIGVLILVLRYRQGNK